MKFFVKKIAPLILAIAVLFEGVSYGFALMNVSDDLAVIAGTLLLALTITLVVTFLMHFYVKPFLKQLGESR